MDNKNDITKTINLISLQCLLVIIPNHVQSGKEFHGCLLIRGLISDEIISDIDVSCTLSNFSSTIILQFDCDMVIFIDNIFMDLVSLLFQEVSGLSTGSVHHPL